MAKNKRTINHDTVEVTAVSELDKLIYFDSLFRRRLSIDGNTAEVVANKIKLHNEEFGTEFPCGKNSLLAIKEKLYSYGAHFKEEKGGPSGRATLYEYIDPKQPLKGLERAIGKALKAQGTELLDLLEKKKAATPHEVWAKLFLSKMIDEGKACIDYISFGENVNLTGVNEYFEVLLKHIMDKQPIEIGYKPFDAEPRILQMHPYYLKMYNSRWFLIGKMRDRHLDCVAYYETLTNIALDRIAPCADGVAIRVWQGVEFIENNVDLSHFYDEMIGVTDTGEPQDVILRLDKIRYNYVRTSPLVANQTELKADSEHYCEDKPTIKIHVKINKELVQRILSFGKDIEVIAPQNLRDAVAEEVKTMQNVYN